MLLVGILHLRNKTDIRSTKIDNLIEALPRKEPVRIAHMLKQLREEGREGSLERARPLAGREQQRLCRPLHRVLTQLRVSCVATLLREAPDLSDC